VAAFLANVKATIYGFHGKTIDDLQGIGLGRRVAQRLFIRSYNRVITLNQRMAYDFAGECSLSSGQIRIIANGVDIQHFSPCANRSDLRGQFGLPPDRLILGNVARLDPVKNHELIIRTLPQLRQHPSRPFFLLVGEGGHRPVLEEQIKRLGLAEDVKLFGYSERIPALLNCMDLYIQSSFYEGFSNTILEAMACGVPVLASRVGGTTDLFTDGEQGLLFPSDDGAALAELITRLADDGTLRRSMAERARGHVIEHFSVQTMARQYEALYQELAEPRFKRS
jgi:glycosyltransferase involved in cell wall biosynthesis